MNESLRIERRRQAIEIERSAVARKVQAIHLESKRVQATLFQHRLHFSEHVARLRSSMLEGVSPPLLTQAQKHLSDSAQVLMKLKSNCDSLIQQHKALHQSLFRCHNKILALDQRKEEYARARTQRMDARIDEERQEFSVLSREDEINCINQVLDPTLQALDPLLGHGHASQEKMPQSDGREGRHVIDDSSGAFPFKASARSQGQEIVDNCSARIREQLDIKSSIQVECVLSRNTRCKVEVTRLENRQLKIDVHITSSGGLDECKDFSGLLYQALRKSGSRIAAITLLAPTR